MLSTISSYIWGSDVQLSENKENTSESTNIKIQEVTKKQKFREKSPQCEDWVLVGEENLPSVEKESKESSLNCNEAHHQESRQAELVKSNQQKRFHEAQVKKQRCTDKVINRKALKRSDMVLFNKSRSKFVFKSVGSNKNLKQC